jgi:hypothetical protein
VQFAWATARHSPTRSAKSSDSGAACARSAGGRGWRRRIPRREPEWPASRRCCDTRRDESRGESGVRRGRPTTVLSAPAITLLHPVTPPADPPTPPTQPSCAATTTFSNTATATTPDATNTAPGTSPDPTAHPSNHPTPPEHQQVWLRQSTPPGWPRHTNQLTNSSRALVHPSRSTPTPPAMRSRRTRRWPVGCRIARGGC